MFGVPSQKHQKRRDGYSKLKSKSCKIIDLNLVDWVCRGIAQILLYATTTYNEIKLVNEKINISKSIIFTKCDKFSAREVLAKKKNIFAIFWEKNGAYGGVLRNQAVFPIFM